MFLRTISGLPDGETSFWLLFILLQLDSVVQPCTENVVCSVTMQTIPEPAKKKKLEIMKQKDDKSVGV